MHKNEIYSNDFNNLISQQLVHNLKFIDIISFITEYDTYYHLYQNHRIIALIAVIFQPLSFSYTYK